MSMDRREFTKAAVLCGVGAAAVIGTVVKSRNSSPGRDSVGVATQRTLDVLKNIKPAHNDDVILRMQRELVKSMAKPVEQRDWVMVIDTRKCVGCHACTVSCIAENKLPAGVVYRPVVTDESGSFPNIKLRFTPRPCMQCDNPPCVPVCPVAATWKRPDGIVAVDYDACIGCRYCIAACPYGARTSDFGESYTSDCAKGSPTGEDRPLQAVAPWEQKPSPEYGKSWNHSEHDSPVGNARKCHFCVHKLEVGQLPSCTSTCIGRATYFGDMNEPGSLVNELIAKNNVQTLLPHLGTKPSVFYIV
jgi:molybdopterin-containing oxidoreductase family iron-sulfur binding subunit